MDISSKHVIFIVALLSSNAFAGFANVTPPNGIAGVSGSLTYTQKLSDVSFLNGLRGFLGSINLGGRSISVPLAFRFAPAAAALAARAVFLNPAVVGTLIAGTVINQWFSTEGFSINSAGNGWIKQDSTVCSVAPCYEFRASSSDIWTRDAKSVATQALALASSATVIYNLLSVYAASKTYTYTRTVSGTTQSTIYTGNLTARDAAPLPSVALPVSESEFVNTLSPKPIPAGLPQLLNIPLPILSPIINPSAAEVPLPQTLRVPIGLPALIPASSPPLYKTPIIDLIPTSTEWTVDVVPSDLIKTDSTPLPSTSTPNSIVGQTITPSIPDFCDRNPDAFSCKKLDLGTLDVVPIPNTQKSLSIVKDSGWGPENASCPAPKTAHVMSMSLSMPLTPLCDFANAIRPLLIAFSWLSATLIFFGFGKKN